MGKSLFKTMIGLLILFALLIVFTSHHSFAGSMDSPLCSIIVKRNGDPRLIKDIGGEWTPPILVYSDKHVNVYTGEDTINGNLFNGNFYGDFLGTGNFLAQLYLKIKDNNSRKQIIESLKSDISKQPSLAMNGHPDLLTYVVYYAFFDMKNNIVSLRKWEKFLDRDGDLILVRDVQKNIPLDNKSNFKLIASGIIAALNKAKSDPKVAYKINEMQRHGENMTDAWRDQSVMNAKRSRAWKKDHKTEQFTMKNSGGLTEHELYSKVNALWDNNNAQYTDPPKAIEYLTEIIRLKPNDAIPYYCRGCAYYCLRQYQQALKDYNEAIRLKANFAEAYGNRGLVYDLLGHYQQGIKDYDEAIRLKPNAVAYRNRGTAYERLKEYKRAIEDYDEAIRFKPDFSDAYNNRGLAYILTGNKQEGCRSLVRACELGNCNDYNISKQKGDCR